MSFLFLGFPRLGDVHRNPADLWRVELSPTVIAGNVGLVLVLGERKADVEPGGNVVCAQHAYEWRVKIGAVAVLGVAGPHRVAAAPTGSGLVIAKSREQIVVGSFSFGDAPRLAAGHLLGEGLDLAVGWDELVRLNEAGHRCRDGARLAIFALKLCIVAARVLAASDLILQCELGRARRRIA